MTAMTISLPLDPETATAYSAASAEERAKLEILLRLQLRDYLLRPKRPLGQVMDELSDRAQARGLTPEILESILNER